MTHNLLLLQSSLTQAATLSLAALLTLFSRIYTASMNAKICQVAILKPLLHIQDMSYRDITDFTSNRYMYNWRAGASQPSRTTGTIFLI